MIERTALEMSQGLYSDVHKDVYGFRPRHCSEDRWNDIQWLDAEVESLAVELEANMKHEEKVQAENVTRFEVRVEETIKVGAGNRKTAIEWLMDGEECNGDDGYMEYLWNIPYGYLSR